MMQVIIKSKGLQLLEEFDKAAQNYGWSEDVLSSNAAKEYKDMYIIARQNLVDYIERLEEDV